MGVQIRFHTLVMMALLTSVYSPLPVLATQTPHQIGTSIQAQTVQIDKIDNDLRTYYVSNYKIDLTKFNHMLKGFKPLLVAMKTSNEQKLDEIKQQLKQEQSELSTDRNLLETIKLNQSVQMNAQTDQVKFWEHQIDEKDKQIANLQRQYQQIQDVPAQFANVQTAINSVADLGDPMAKQAYNAFKAGHLAMALQIYKDYYQSFIQQQNKKSAKILVGYVAALETNNQYDEAIKKLEEAVDKDPENKEYQEKLGETLGRQGYYERMKRLFEYYLAEKNNPTMECSAKFYINQAENELGHLDQAQSWAEQYLKLVENKQSLDKSSAYSILGAVYDDKGKYAKAIDYYQQALAIDKISLPSNHPSIATDLNNLGSVYYGKGEYDKAIDHFQEALAIDKISLPSNHPSIATELSNLGAVYDDKEEYAKAIDYYQQALAIEKVSLPPNHPSIATTLANLGVAYDNKEEYAKAIDYYQQALVIKKVSLPPNHPSIATTLNNLGWAYKNKGNLVEADRCFQQAKQIRVNHEDVENNGK